MNCAVRRSAARTHRSELTGSIVRHSRNPLALARGGGQQTVGNLSTSHITSKIDGVSLVDSEVDIQLGPLQSQFSVEGKEKTLDLKTHSTYEDISVQGVNFGQLEEGMQYRQLDKNSVELLGQITSKIFVDIVRNANLIAAKNSSEMNAAIERIFQPHIFSLSAAAISLFNQKPEIQYGPIVLTNSAGKSEFKAELGLLLPRLDVTNEQEMILDAIGNTNINLVLNEKWATQFLMDTATLLAKKNKRSLPTEEDRKVLAEIMKNMTDALVSTKLAAVQEGDSGNIRFSIQAKPELGQSIRDTKNVVYNGMTYSVPEFLHTISERATEADKRLDELGVEQELTAFMNRFNSKSAK